MLLKEKKGFFLSEYTIRVILLLVVAMIVIKFCSDMIDLKTENNPAVRSRNAVKGLAEAIGEVAGCSSSNLFSGDFMKYIEDKTIYFYAPPQILDIQPSDAYSAQGYRSYREEDDTEITKFIEGNPNYPCIANVPFSFDFDNWYFSINSRPSPTNPSEDIIVISYYEKIPDGFSLDWTSGNDIKIGSSLLLNDGGGINSDEINNKFKPLEGRLPINIDRIGFVKVIQSPNMEEIMVFVEGEAPFGGTQIRVRFIVT